MSIEQSLLDRAGLPVEELAQLATREGRRPLAGYQAHKWFARRFGSAFRALLTAAALSPDQDFWPAYYDGVSWQGKTVLDPFVGGGTSVVEALRTGASVIGVDVDAVACAITRFELGMAALPDLEPALNQLMASVGERLAPFYRTVSPSGKDEVVLHYFWVQAVECKGCAALIEVHPRYQLAYEAEGTKQWAFCRACHEIQTLDRDAEALDCSACEEITPIQQGVVHYGTLRCPQCQTEERLIDVAARTGKPPLWRLFALETLDTLHRKRVPMKERRFRTATARDREFFEKAATALEQRTAEGALPWIPQRAIPREGRSDDRLISYGYTEYAELFNARQLLHLSYLAEAISELTEPVREAMAIAFSDHLTTNCMMTHYAFGWRRLQPLFSVRAYRHVPRPVEVNPWLDGTGRGTFPNAVRQVQRAARWARQPKDALVDGGFQDFDPERGQPVKVREDNSATILHQNANGLNQIASESVDLILTDPPYFDNIAYSELSDFFLPWLEQFGLAPSSNDRVLGWHENLAAPGRGEAEADAFQQGLLGCFREMHRVLKPEGRLVFTFQHRTPDAWMALARVIREAGFCTIQLFPLLGDGSAGLHKNSRTSSSWDAVFVLVKGAPSSPLDAVRVADEQLARADAQLECWVRRLGRSDCCTFNHADQLNFYRACLVGQVTGHRPTRDEGPTQHLPDLLANAAPDATLTKE